MKPGPYFNVKGQKIQDLPVHAIKPKNGNDVVHH
jgi:hypothetical protein